MYASIHYIQTKHPYGEFPSQPSQVPGANDSNSAQQNGENKKKEKEDEEACGESVTQVCVGRDLTYQTFWSGSLNGPEEIM